VSDEQILDATRQAVLESGVQSSLDLIAERVGVTSPALLKRFGNRQALMIAALSPDMRQLDAIFEVPIDARPFDAQLEALIDRLSQYFMDMLPRAMALRQCFSSIELEREKCPTPPLVRAVEQMTRWLSAIHRQGLIETGHIETAATALVGAVSTRIVSGYFSQRMWSRKSQEKYQKELTTLFVSGLGTRAPSRRQRQERREISAPLGGRGRMRTRKTRP
jgi:AcrR family transcriptional regulator